MIDLTNDNIHVNAGLNGMLDKIIPYLNNREKPIAEIRVNVSQSIPIILKKAFYSIGYSVAILRIPVKHRAYSIYTVSLCDVFNKDETKRCSNCAEYTVINSLITNRHYCTTCGEDCTNIPY